MKPLPAVPLTDEDRAAWFDWQVSRRRAWVRDWLLWGALENLSFAADRRDAELMLGREAFRRQCARLGAPQMPPRLWLVCIGNPTATARELW